MASARANPTELKERRFARAAFSWVKRSSSNAPSVANWNAAATAPRTKTAATNVVDFDATDARGFLMVGTNVLAFQSLNATTNRQQLLLLPQLIGLSANGPPVARYFPVPTPGQPNNAGVATIGPLILDAQHTPDRPADATTSS